MARNPSSQKKERLEKQFRAYMAKHQDSVRAGGEAYEFNIKMYGINIPDIVRRTKSEDYIFARIDDEQQERLEQFAETMQRSITYPWISKWGQVGRSGGWLFFATDEPVLDTNWEIPERGTFDNDPQDWNPTDLKPAEQRLDDLIEIETLLKKEKRALAKDFASPAWWDVGPHDWTPRTKPKMGGIFDFMKRKKPPEKQELLLPPVDVIPSGGLIPAGAAADPFLLLAPLPAPRGVALYSPQEARPMFDVLAPAAPGAAAPSEPLWLPPAPAPAAAPAPRPRAAWSLPTPEELAGHLRRMLDLSRIFSQVRASRKSPDFRRNLDRWARQGLPALIPIIPVATSDQYEDFTRFFGIPESVLEEQGRRGDAGIWNDLLWPLFDILSAALEGEKPADLPGWFALEHDPDTDEWWLVYLETE